MLKKSSSQEPLGQFQLGRKHAGEIGIQICSNKGSGPFWGPNKGQNKENFDKSSKIFFS